MINNLAPELITFLEQAPIFFQPWWLEAVSPGNWGYSVAKRGASIVGVLPYTYKIRLKKYCLQDLPPIYSYYGPWIKASTARYSRRMSEEKQIMEEMIDNLPDFAIFNQWFHPYITNWLPFYWKDFKQTTRYTYLINSGNTLEEIWNGTRENIRTDIRKAEKILDLVEENSVNNFYGLLEKTYGRQSLNIPFGVELLNRIDCECGNRGIRKILLAVDQDGNFHAGAYLVWDGSTVYSILRGADPDLRNSGANSLVSWKSIEYAISSNKNFDFCGSWNQSIEKFILAFGAVQIPFFEILKMNSILLQTYRSIRKVIKLRI